MNNKRLWILMAVLLLAGVEACKAPRLGLFQKSPHEEYGRSLEDAGLGNTALGRKWFAAAQYAVTNPVDIELPYKETGYFAAEYPQAAGLRFNAKRGQKLRIVLQKNPDTAFALFMEVWQPEGNDISLEAAAEPGTDTIVREVKDDRQYIIRLQPELLKSGDYTLTIEALPSLAFPVIASVKSRIISTWGMDRDGGARRHEGIDIAAPRNTPLVAAAAGTITRVETTELGGKVVWLRPEGRPYSLYYAHLDSQLVSPGQRVNEGDIIGLMGTTGNARGGTPHLHFGIYAMGGATDPLPYVQVDMPPLREITADTARLGIQARSERKLALYNSPDRGGREMASLDANTLMIPEAATDNYYRVILPDGSKGYISSNSISKLTPLREATVKGRTALLDAPVRRAPRKKRLEAETTVKVMGSFKDFYYISDGETEGWIRAEEI